MTDGRQAHVARRRLVRAIVIVAMLVGMAPGVEAARGLVAEPVGGSQTVSGIRTESLAFGADPFEAIDEVERATESEGRELPEAFADEVGMLADARDVRVDATGSVIGYAVDGAESEVLERLTSHMEAGGWASVPLGEAGGATFVKSEGRCTWALATCTQAGSAVSVVVRCVIR